jgi:hypothetical protein
VSVLAESADVVLTLREAQLRQTAASLTAAAERFRELADQPLVIDPAGDVGEFVATLRADFRALDALFDHGPVAA